MHIACYIQLATPAVAPATAVGERQDGRRPL